MITDQKIDRVMSDTGMERVQAHRHLRDRAIVQRLDADRLRAAADAATARHGAAMGQTTFRSLGELSAAIMDRVAIVEDEPAFIRSVEDAVANIGPGKLCYADGVRNCDWIDDLSPEDAAAALYLPISESRKVCPFPITRAEFARLKEKAS